MLIAQSNLATSYDMLGQTEECLGIRRDVYSGRLKLNGKEHEETLRAANNYANSLVRLKRFEEAKSLLRKTIPVGRRVSRDGDENTLRLRWLYGEALYQDPGATLKDLREAVATLEEIERIARRVLGGAHPLTSAIEGNLQHAQATLFVRETLPPGTA